MAHGTLAETQSLTLAELLDRFGPIPARRIRTTPPPGTATEDDLLALDGSERICELIDGVLVEKAVGYFEARLAAVLVYFIEKFFETHDLGYVVGPDGGSRLAAGQIRFPDVSVVLWSRVPGRRVPRVPFADVVPDLAVEVFSPGNTDREMEHKLRDYFEAGVRRVWYVDPPTRTVRVYTGVDQMTETGPDGLLDDSDLLPGFTLSLADWFARAEHAR